MNRILIGIMASSLVATSAFADCESVYRFTVSWEKSRLASGDTYVNSSESWNDDGRLPVFASTTGIADGLAVTRAMPNGDQGPEAFVSMSALLGGTYGTAWTVSTIHDRQVLREHERILDILTQTQSDGVELRSYVETLHKDPLLGLVQRSILVTMIEDGSENEVFCPDRKPLRFDEFDRLVRQRIARTIHRD